MCKRSGFWSNKDREVGHNGPSRVRRWTHLSVGRWAFRVQTTSPIGTGAIKRAMLNYCVFIRLNFLISFSRSLGSNTHAITFINLTHWTKLKMSLTWSWKPNLNPTIMHTLKWVRKHWKWAGFDTLIGYGPKTKKLRELTYAIQWAKVWPISENIHNTPRNAQMIKLPLLSWNSRNQTNSKTNLTPKPTYSTSK